MQMRHSVDADIGFWINHDLAVFNRSYDIGFSTEVYNLLDLVGSTNTVNTRSPARAITIARNTCWEYRCNR
jgi:hypothetical protein